MIIQFFQYFFNCLEDGINKYFPSNDHDSEDSSAESEDSEEEEEDDEDKPIKKAPAAPADNDEKKKK